MQEYLRQKKEEDPQAFKIANKQHKKNTSFITKALAAVPELGGDRHTGAPTDADRLSLYNPYVKIAGSARAKGPDTKAEQIAKAYMALPDEVKPLVAEHEKLVPETGMPIPKDDSARSEKWTPEQIQEARDEIGFTPGMEFSAQKQRSIINHYLNKKYGKKGGPPKTPDQVLTEKAKGGGTDAEAALASFVPAVLKEEGAFKNIKDEGLKKAIKNWATKNPVEGVDMAMFDEEDSLDSLLAKSQKAMLSGKYEEADALYEQAKNRMRNSNDATGDGKVTHEDVNATEGPQEEVAATPEPAEPKVAKVKVKAKPKADKDTFLSEEEAEAFLSGNWEDKTEEPKAKEPKKAEMKETTIKPDKPKPKAKPKEDEEYEDEINPYTGKTKRQMDAETRPKPSTREDIENFSEENGIGPLSDEEYEMLNKLNSRIHRKY
jgi:hypothetical protein